MNSINISGNLIRNAEIKYIGKNNTPCVEFVIAKNHKFKNERGNTEEQVMFFEVVLFGQFGERILQFLNKGKKSIYKENYAKKRGSMRAKNMLE